MPTTSTASHPLPAPLVTDRATGSLPALVWLSWALAAAAAIQLAPNPLYVAVVIAISLAAVQTASRRGPLRGAFPLVIGAGVVFAAVRLVLNALTTHGVGDVLFAIPDATLPAVFGGFTVGGTVETPVLVQVAVEGLAIVGILAVFAAFNTTVSHHELVEAAPRAFFELGLAVTVAVAFVPSVIAAVGAVRDADRARTGGTVVRRGRLVRQLVPVLETGMERAVGLAESMDSRGFARPRAERCDAGRERTGGWLGLGALLLLAAAFVALVAQAPTTGAALALGGAALLAAAIVATSQANRRLRYRPRRLAPRDAVLLAAPWCAPGALVALAASGDATLRWPLVPSASGALSLAAIAAVAVLAAVPVAAGARQ